MVWYVSLSCWLRHSVPKGVCSFPQGSELYCQTSGRKQLVLTTEIYHWHIPPLPAGAVPGWALQIFVSIVYHSGDFHLKVWKQWKREEVSSTSKCALTLCLGASHRWMNDFLVIYSILSGFFLWKFYAKKRVLIKLLWFELDLGHVLMAFPFSHPYFPV